MVQHSFAMQRRRFLQLGLGAALVMAVVGGAVVWLRPGLQAGRIAPAVRSALARLSEAILDRSLPADESARASAVAAQIDRLDAFIAGLPAATRDELSQLLGLLAAPPGRRLLVGLSTDWPQATVEEVRDALQDMRLSSLSLRQQAYHALRDLTNGTYFSEPQAWAGIGYPGPVDL
jgi:hypothetical protein